MNGKTISIDLLNMRFNMEIIGGVQNISQTCLGVTKLSKPHNILLL